MRLSCGWPREKKLPVLRHDTGSRGMEGVEGVKAVCVLSTQSSVSLIFGNSTKFIILLLLAWVRDSFTFRR